MSTKFFTNDGENTLLQKFAAVFENNPSLVEFDALVGYFRSTGYFRLRPYLENIEQIRILVGIDVDKATNEAQQKGLSLRFGANKDQVLRDFQGKLTHEIETAQYDSQIEQSVQQFVADIAAKKIEIKAHPSRNLHAKIYIFRPKEFNEHSGGEVITGSSNLTEAGLGANDNTSNYEFNVSLRDYADIKFATDEFEKLWEESTDILPEQVSGIINQTYLRDDFTPEDLYLKLLIEYFGKEINFDPNSITDLPRGWKRLNYQMDAVEQGYNLLKKHNGFFLADVVGLGKTVIATLIARKYFYLNGYPEYRSHILVVCPPAVKQNWEETIEKFELDNVKFITTGSLHKIANAEKYDLVIVDEAHKFRNSATESYAQLQRICNHPCRNEGPKRVILVSATPLNNRPDDIKNQLLLFQDANASTLDVNLASFFAYVSAKYQELIGTIKVDKTKIQKLYEKIRLKILEPLTVRRTRTDLLQHPLYKEDLLKQGIIFPKVNDPEHLLYQLNPRLNELYVQTVERILNKENEGLQYTRHRLIEFLQPEHRKDYQRPDLIAQRLAAIMRTLLVKRLDSSFYAFHQSLKRFVKTSEILIKMWDNNRIIIAPNVDIEPYIEEDREEELLEKLVNEQLTDPGIKILPREGFDPALPELLQNDHEILQDMEQQWRQVIEQPDPKLEQLLEQLSAKLLNPKQNPEKKLVIFSESADTTNYLEKKLQEKNYRVLAVTSRNRKERQNTIRQNFDANQEEANQKSDYDIIISTESLAEGVNLHRANAIVNYDTPWNATRLMQRIGRINRIGSKAEFIYIYNFFPTEQVEGDIRLWQNARIKLQAFHTALGEDSQIYTPDEEFETFGLFDKSVSEDQETNERLTYLMEIRQYKENYPDEFKRIENLPLKIRNAVADNTLRSNTLCFLRNPVHDAFYRIDKDNEKVDELGFLEAVKIFKSHRKDQEKPLPDTHHRQVQKAVDHFIKEIQEKVVAEQQVPHLTPREISAVSYLKAFSSLDISSAKEKQRIQEAIKWIRLGRSQNLSRDLQKLKRNQAKMPVAPVKQLEAIINIIDKHMPETEQQPDDDMLAAKPQANQLPKIIISQSYVSS